MQAYTINPPYDTDGDGTEETDLFAEEEACDKDDLIIFKANGQLSLDEGATKCDPGDPQTVDAGTWAFKNNETEIQLTGSSDSNLIQIIELTESRLKVKWSESEDGVTYTFEQTFVH